MTRPDPHHRLLLQWLLFAGILVFAIWVAWDHGLLEKVYRSDPTRLSLVISLLFVAATIHCAARALYLSRQLNHINAIRHLTAQQRFAPRLRDGQLVIGNAHAAGSLPAVYLAAILAKYQAKAPGELRGLEHAQLTEVLAEQARGPHETGWFVTGLLLKLGLLGTVIGFVLMLGSVSGIESFDVQDVQAVLKNMTVGMAVALNTTLIGLLGSMLLGFQYLLLDRGADKLVADTVHYAETSLLPVQPARNG